MTRDASETAPAPMLLRLSLICIIVKQFVAIIESFFLFL